MTVGALWVQRDFYAEAIAFFTPLRPSNPCTARLVPAFQPCGLGRGNRARPLRRASCSSDDPLGVHQYAVGGAS